jgi:oligopeptidase A
MSTNIAENPLLKIQFRIPFDQIRAEHVEPAIEELLKEAREKQKALAESQGPRTFENTLLALEDLAEKLEYAMKVVGHLESVSTYPELRAAYNAVQAPVSAFTTGLVLDPGLWRVIKEYAATSEAQQLTGTRKRLLTKTVDAFRRHGADLDETGKAKLSGIDVQLAQITTKFSENVLDATNAFELVITDETKLAGLPPSAVNAARESAKAKGVEGWRFTLQGPSFSPMMTYLDDRGTREQLYRVYMGRAASGALDNRENLRRILELRRAKADLLGYPNFADLVLEDRMAHRGEKARTFLEELKAKTAHRFEQENEELKVFANMPDLEGWDVAYYAEKQRQALYEFDEEALRPYFPVNRVVAGMFDIVNRLYGIRVVEESGVPAWDPQTKYYSILDSDGTKLGSFYADWFPREKKRGGAWMDSLLTGHPKDGQFEPHLGLICGNLTPPIGDQPALLTHREVETIFHEFGHLLHHSLSRVEVRSLAGTNVPWDFVELPSQIMENWCWEREALDMFARHFQTGEPIPEDLFQKMKRAKTFRSANGQMRQLGLGVLDLSLHMEYDPRKDGDVVEYCRRLQQEYAPAKLPEGYAMICGFTHLFSSPVGYGAGYYSYKWAEVLDADAFTRFRATGIFNRETGMSFRENILAKGDSEDPAELYRHFMGRDPQVNALLERLALV